MYLPQSTALVDNTLLDLHNSLDETQPYSLDSAYCLHYRCILGGGGGGSKGTIGKKITDVLSRPSSPDPALRQELFIFLRLI